MDLGLSLKLSVPSEKVLRKFNLIVRRFYAVEYVLVYIRLPELWEPVGLLRTLCKLFGTFFPGFAQYLQNVFYVYASQNTKPAVPPSAML